MKDQLMGVMVDAAMREAIRRAAFEERCSMGELIRRAVQAYVEPAVNRREGPMAKLETPTAKFWIREMRDGTKRVGGTVINQAKKDGKLSNADLFFEGANTLLEIIDYLVKKKKVKL